jgi:uncharacterized YceG family protein
MEERSPHLRRIVVALILVGVLAGGAWAGAGLLKNDSPPTVTNTVPVLQKLHVIFPEGFTRDDMANRVDAVREIASAKRNLTPRLTRGGYLKATANAKPPRQFRKDWPGDRIEGFLFPATYEFTQNTTSTRLVRDQLSFFAREWGKVNLAYARSKNLTPYDVLIIASMIEKEVAVPSERRLVAAVIYNRLHRRMALQIDATTRYGLGIPPTQSLTNADLNSSSPYNTRNRPGLPPTPIANPGLASIQAAAHPASVDYLFFLRKPDKRHHFFTASQAEFDRKSCEYGYTC